MDGEKVQNALMRIIFAALVGMIGLGGLAFFVTPAHPDGVREVVSTLSQVVLGGIIGKASLAIPTVMRRDPPEQPKS